MEKKKEYLDKDVLFEKLYDAWGFDIDGGPCNSFMEIVNSTPAADVAPVQRGKWNLLEKTVSRKVCSCCGWDGPEYIKFYSWCPNCGAKMDTD